MKIFLDSSFIIAYAINKDENNNLAIDLRKKGIFDNECYINNLVINEIVTVIGNKGDIELAIEIYETIKDNCFIINEYYIANFNDKVINTYKKYNTKLSFTDCGVLVTMEENNINNLVSFDKYFDRVPKLKRIH